MSKPKYRIGTRGSKLALTQTRGVIDLLRSFEPEAEFLVEVYLTCGERDEHAIPEPDAKGLYTAEIERALLKKEIDLAVHPAKDIPIDLSPGLTIAAFTPRIDPREAFLSRNRTKLNDLKQGDIVGVSSLLRRFQIARLRPDLNFAELRGNIDSRIHKVHSGEYNAIVLSMAGLIRLSLEHESSEIFPLDMLLPPAGQGTLALECRHDDLRIFKLLEIANYQPTAWAVLAERAVLRNLGIGGNYPIGVSASFPHGFASRDARKLHLQAILFDLDTHEYIRAEAWGTPGKWKSLSEKVAKKLISKNIRLKNNV